MLNNFQNATEYLIEDITELDDISNMLSESHVLVQNSQLEDNGHFLFVSANMCDEDLEESLEKVFTLCYTPSDLDESKENETKYNKDNKYVLLINTKSQFIWEGRVLENIKLKCPTTIKENHIRLISRYADKLDECKRYFQDILMEASLIVSQIKFANDTLINENISCIKKQFFVLSKTIISSVEIIRKPFVDKSYSYMQNVFELVENCFAFAAEFCSKVVKILDIYYRVQLKNKMIRLAIEWVSFVCNDCNPSDRKTFRWTVIALEFTMNMTQGNNIHSINEFEFECLRSNVAGCMTLLISHFDIQGARGTHEITFRKEYKKTNLSEKEVLNPTQFLNSPILSSNIISSGLWSRKVNEKLMKKLEDLEKKLELQESAKRKMGKVLDNERPENQSLLFLASSNSNISIRWKQGKFLGAGTFGSVYLAVNLDTGDMMAVKEFKFPDPAQLVSLYKSIKEEMSVMELLNHPNIVSYYGIEVHRDKVFLFMEYCQGGSLGKLLEHGRIEDEHIIRIYALQMLRGLSYLHENNIMHRDVKPDNILLDHAGVVKFVDFGAAKVAKNQKTYELMSSNKNRDTTAPQNKAKGTLVGTPMYMAPEVITGKDEGCKGAQDIWSLGCCVLEMITGKRPWSNLDNEWAIMYHIVTGHPPLPDPSEISECALDFMRLCFTPKPYLRPTAVVLLEHAWFDTVDKNQQNNNNNIITSVNSRACNSLKALEKDNFASKSAPDIVTEKN